MDLEFSTYQLPQSFNRFRWQRFSGQNSHFVTYIYLVKPSVCRLRGESSVLYVGKTKDSIAERYKKETQTRNTPGNSQATNLRLSHLIPLLRGRGDEIELYFTDGLSFPLPPAEAADFGKMLETWNKSHFRSKFKQDVNSIFQVEIETFLLIHYAAAHWEVPPLNNSC